MYDSIRQHIAMEIIGIFVKLLNTCLPKRLIHAFKKYVLNNSRFYNYKNNYDTNK